MNRYTRYVLAVTGLGGVPAAVHAAVAGEPPTQPAFQQGALPSAGPNVLNAEQRAHLHALLQKYALGCGNPMCPVCRPQQGS